MKKIAFVFIMVFSLILCSCRHKEVYSFMNSEDDIVAITIIAISFTDDDQLIQSEIVSIEDEEDFIEAFQELPCYTFYGDPIGICDIGAEVIVIKILYENNEYELINWCGQSKYYNDNGLKFYAGYSVFDETEFTKLINDYLFTNSE